MKPRDTRDIILRKLGSEHLESTSDLASLSEMLTQANAMFATPLSVGEVKQIYEDCRRAWLSDYSSQRPMKKDKQTKVPVLLRPFQVAKILGSNTQSVRVRLQQDLFDPPIGTACLAKGSIRYSYEVYPERLAAYLNVSIEEMFRRLNPRKEQNREKTIH